MISIEEFQKKGQNLLVDRRAGERGVGVEGKQVEETPDELLLDGGGDGDAACDKKQSGQLRESRTRWTIPGPHEHGFDVEAQPEAPLGQDGAVERGAEFGVRWREKVYGVCRGSGR